MMLQFASKRNWYKSVLQQEGWKKSPGFNNSCWKNHYIRAFWLYHKWRKNKLTFLLLFLRRQNTAGPPKLQYSSKSQSGYPMSIYTDIISLHFKAYGQQDKNLFWKIHLAFFVCVQYCTVLSFSHCKLSWISYSSWQCYRNAVLLVQKSRMLRWLSACRLIHQSSQWNSITHWWALEGARKLCIAKGTCVYWYHFFKCFCVDGGEKKMRICHLGAVIKHGDCKAPLRIEAGGKIQ